MSEKKIIYIERKSPQHSYIDTQYASDPLFLLFSSELLIQFANIYYHCNCHGRRQKWGFLNLKKKEEKELDNESKHKIARDVVIIENFAITFGCSEIVSNGNDDIFQIGDKINEKDIGIKTKAMVKRISAKRSSSGGLDIVKKQLLGK